MREQNIHEKVVNIDNQRKKKYFSGLGDLSVLLSSPEREFLCLVGETDNSYQMW